MTTFNSSRVGISVNLPSGANYDILLVSTPEFPVGALSFKFEDTPRKITGIQKVAQVFLKILFTTKGSDVIYTNLGTSFPSLVIGANIQSSHEELVSDISTAIQDAENQTRYYLNSGDDSSMLDSVTLGGFEDGLTPDSLSIYLTLTTVAGETASIAVPFPELS